MNLILLLSISIFFIDLKFSVSTRLIKIFSFLFLALLPLSIYSSIRVFDSSKDQLVLLRQFI